MGRQLLEDVKYRKEWAEKVGLGFDLPQASKQELKSCGYLRYKLGRAELCRKCVSVRSEWI